GSLAIARLLSGHQYKKLYVRIARFSQKVSDDFNINLERLKQTHVPIIEINKGDELSEENSTIIVDALLGSGLNKPLEGDYE
ncbi:NAD(P)H-hydrate epimerase, partial [Rhizobium ruizarguesonis]